MSQIYQVRQCLNPACQLRYPLLKGSRYGERCPNCRGETQAVTEHRFQMEAEKRPEQANPPLEAFLDNIRSAWNVGSMFRTADGLGLQRIYLGGISPTPENGKVAKTALGAESAVAWEYQANGVELARRLLDAGHELWVLECTPQAVPLSELPAELPAAGIVLVVGNENFGVDPEILALCNRTIAIPMQGRKRSLNAAVAFGIAAYALRAKCLPGGMD